MQARAAGALAVKLFPTSLVRLGGLQALLGPFPDVAFVPTGGIAPDEVSQWLAVGALAVGGGLAPPTLHGHTDRTALTDRVRAVLADLGTRHPGRRPS